MNELTKDQWQKSMSTGFGDGNHPINHENPHHDTLKVKLENSEMAMSDMTKAIKYSDDIQKMFDVNDDLEDWVKAKLNHAADYVATVRDYLKFYHDEKESINELSNEEKELKSKYKDIDKTIDAIQYALDIAGLEQTIGSVADGTNAVISLLRAALTQETNEKKKHLLNAAISGVSVIPFGDLAKLIKIRLFRKPAVKLLKFVKKYLKSSSPSYADKLIEKWSRSYKKSINCSHPKGFSQRAHCAGRRARRAGKRTRSHSVSEIEVYNEVLKDLIEDTLEENSSMAMGALKQIHNDAQELQSLLTPQMELPDWCKSKLNLAGEYLDDIYHHLDHFGPDGRELDEVGDAAEPEFYKRRRKQPTLRFTISEIGYWVSPDGEMIKVGDHTKWVRDNRDKILGFKADEPYTSAFKNGYVRVVYLPDDNSIKLHNSGEDESYGFYVNGNSKTGTPPVKSAVKDAIRNFIKEKNIVVIVDDRGKLTIDEVMDESWGKTLATAALAASTMFGTPSVQGDTQSKTTTTAVAQKQAPYTVEDIIAATLVDEAGGEKNAVQGMHAVLNVILNRVKGDVRKGAMECLRPKQFSGWNKVNKKSADDIKKFIDSKRGHKQFKNALSLVDQAKNKTLTDITKGSNHFLNVQLTKQQRKGGKLPSWYDSNKVVVDYGNHRFLKLEELNELA